MIDRPTKDQLNRLAESLFPIEWREMLFTTGKARSRKRATLRMRAHLHFIKINGGSCENCRHRGRRVKREQLVCQLDTDFHGTTITWRHSRCPSWTPE